MLGRLAQSLGGFDHGVTVFHMHAVSLHAALLFRGESDNIFEHTGDKLATVMMHMERP